MAKRPSFSDPSYAQKEDVSNSMGLFLQKTNIIRDYLDDINHDRVFYPKEVWYGFEELIGPL
jgi:farnesyl-diphosphate farnesyltransferase